MLRSTQGHLIPTLEHVLTFLLRVCVMVIVRLPGPVIIIMASSAPECLRGAAGASSGREIRHRRVRRHRSRRSVLVTSGRWAGRWRNLPRPRDRASSGCHEDTHEVAVVLGEGAVLRRGLQGLFRCEEQNLPRPLVRASSGCRGDTHEVAGVLSEEVVLRRGLQGLPAGAGWYVPEGSGAGPWEDRSASYTGSTWTVSSDIYLYQIATPLHRIPPECRYGTGSYLKVVAAYSRDYLG